MNDRNYRRMLVSILIKFADSDSNMELVAVDERETFTSVVFELKRPMTFIEKGDPAEFSERRKVKVSIGVE